MTDTTSHALPSIVDVTPPPALLAPSRAPLSRLGAKLALAIFGLGFLVIGLGWLGASGKGGQVNHRQVIEAEFPYLLSGGCIGLGLCLLGAALLVAQSQRRDREQLELTLATRLDEIAVLLREAQILAGGSVAPTASTADLVAAGASAYHLPGCRLVDGKAAPLLTRVEAAERGLRPCRSCRA